MTPGTAAVNIILGEGIRVAAVEKQQGKDR
jgi:hypothetical protein